MNSRNDRETDGYTAVDYIKYVCPLLSLRATMTLATDHATGRTIARTLNESHHSPSYSGLGRANTTYPISAFITHLVYLQGTTVEVDEAEITVGTIQPACWTDI